jgi:hypothetical protein
MMDRLLQITSIFLASLTLGVCLFLCGEIVGFRDGMLAAYNIESFEAVSRQFITHGPNFFNAVIWQYSVISFCLSVYLTGRFMLKNTPSLVICFSSLAGAIVFCCRLLHFKYDIDESAALLYRKWLTVSVRFDWVCLICLVILIIIQLYATTAAYFAKASRPA